MKYPIFTTIQLKTSCTAFTSDHLTFMTRYILGELGLWNVLLGSVLQGLLSVHHNSGSSTLAGRKWNISFSDDIAIGLSACVRDALNDLSSHCMVIQIVSSVLLFFRE